MPFIYGPWPLPIAGEESDELLLFIAAAASRCGAPLQADAFDSHWPHLRVRRSTACKPLVDT